MQNLRSLLRHREDLFNAVFKQQKRLYTLQTTPAEKLDKKARCVDRLSVYDLHYPSFLPI